MLLCFAGLLVSPGFGCAYLFAAASPIRVEAEKKVERFDPQATHVEAKSSEASHVSGRNNLTLQAVVGEYEAGRVRIDGLLTSTELLNTDPNNFYVYLTAGGRTTPVGRVELGDVTNAPYTYTYNYTVEVEAGKVRFDDGSTATVYEKQRRTATAQEAYYSRPISLVFEDDALASAGADELVLEIRDLGVDMRLRWVREGGAR